VLRRIIASLAVPAVLVTTLGTVAVAANAAPAAHAAATAPNVRCVRLDKAKKKLYMAGFNVKVKGGGFFGVVNERGWVVTSQSTSGNTVTVYAGRSC
jgi:hypothetical protein